MTIRNRILTGKVPVKIWTDEIDQASISQLEKMSEMPSAYKDIDKVMENQNDLVTIEAELKQILCIKG